MTRQVPPRSYFLGRPIPLVPERSTGSKLAEAAVEAAVLVFVIVAFCAVLYVVAP